MATDPVDVDGVIKSVVNPEAPYAGMPDGTVLGHMHLRVGNIAEAEAFYVGILGFEVIFKMPSALFISAGRYHHHIGMNIWHSRNAPPAPADSVGLREYTIILPYDAARAEVLARLDAAGVAYESQGADVLLNDPWNNRIRLVTE
jgi:catechol 2,3-dioxygenase